MFTRRDFLDGVAIGIGGLMLGCGKGEHTPAGSPPFAPEREPGYYPPALTGMRGSHPGSFEVAHQLRDGSLVATPEATDERYDLVIVGAGISGLAAAHYHRRAKGEASSILLLDNHDDVGGHAKRNEFTVDDRVLVSYGGTESIEYPAAYSAIAKQLLADIGIDIAGFRAAFPSVDRTKLGLGSSTFFDRQTFGTDKLIATAGDDWTVAELATTPLSEAARAAIAKLYQPTDHWPKLTSAEQKAKLAKLSYRNFLLEVAKLPIDALALLQTSTHSLYGVGIDAVPALDCWALELPGFTGMRLDRDQPSPGLGRTPQLEMHEGPSVQFPDGNATVARLLVRRLVGALPGRTMKDATSSHLEYARLDGDGPTRIRLNSTVVRVRDQPDGVEVTYLRGGQAKTVRGAACVLACWNGVIPHLVRELPAAQRTALSYGVKVPLVYTNVAIRNWRAFRELGTGDITIPGGYFTSAHLELHDPAAAPDAPAIVKLVRTPCHPGVAARDQHRLGRTELLATPFETFEHQIRDLFGRMLGPGGFDTARDLAGITVNRWPHGYAYEYNSLWDPAWKPGEEPCVIGRAKFGRITIANADAGAYAYTDCAIEQAKRAIDELL